MDPIEFYREWIDSVIGFREWSKTTTSANSYGIESERSDYSSYELDKIS